MKISLCLLALLISTVSFAVPFDLRIDSAHVVALSAKLNQAKVRIRAADESKAATLALEQLYYIVGHLNGYGGGADVSKAKITLGASQAGPEGYLDVLYDAEFTVAWPRGVQAPATLSSVFPLRSDGKGKADFFQAYGPKCAGGDEPAEAFTFFYFYRPQNNTCRLLSGVYNPSMAVPVAIRLSASPLQTNGKSPEYTKVWEDGQLAMTILVGTYADGATSAQDIGVQSYNTVYQTLRKSLGTPYAANVSLGPNAAPGLQYPDVEMSFRVGSGYVVNFNILLIQKSALLKPTQAFRDRYEARTQISDFVSYNGHSGLGANIRALSRLGKFTPKHYQIFMVNGCDTFTYVDKALETAVAAANPGEAGTRFLDLIVNAMPSPFQGFSRNLTAMLGAFLQNKATYRQVLANFDPSQRALVSGEEDNRFPYAF